MTKTNIGIGHVVKALQYAGFGHDEIMTMREAMITNNFNEITFCKDVFTAGCEDENRMNEPDRNDWLEQRDFDNYNREREDY